jgi:phosphomannomutase/phosphoglucomutase
MDTVVSLFAKDILETMPGSPIIYNNLCSRQVTETIEQAGGKPVMWITGHSFIKAKVKAENAPFGGELSGHIYFTDNFYGHDDAAYASLRLMQYLERKNETLSQAAAQLSQYISSPEIKLGLGDDIKFKLIDEKIASDMRAAWPNAEYIKIDGFRIDLPDRMAVIRASQNGPYITVKFEAKTQTDYDQVKKELAIILKKYPEIDWSKGVNTHVLD